MKLRFSILALLGAALLSGCSLVGGGKKDGGSDTSQTTGWKYNDPKYGGFEVKKAYAQPTGPNLVFVEGGLFLMGRVDQDLDFAWNNNPRRITVASFFIDETEVRNVDYREYLHWLKRVYVSYPYAYKNALPDTLVWRSPLSFNEPYVESYLRHPAFNEYPVVGVNWLQANDYCLWRTDRVNELNMVKQGVLKLDNESQKDENNFNTDAYLAGQYEGTINKGMRDLSSPDKNATRRVSFDDGILQPKYRLPTEAEWEYAAVAQLESTYDERIVEHKLYPWSGNTTRNPKKKERGKFMANFQRGKGDFTGVAGYLNDGYAATAPVRSFPPNDFGLYNMAGNVNEWVMDVYRPLSSLEFNEYSPFRGNVYTDPERDAEGNIVPKNELGRIPRDTIGYVADRYNYQIGDNRNYRDGDVLSAVDANISDTIAKNIANSNRMYDPGAGNSGKGMTTLISDKSRVYKGGSFLDRAYWLSPGTRRYLDQDRSAVDIGFRCAMDVLGVPAAQKKAKKKKK